ncbi:MAG TPA: DUF4412 domain-containing protein [Gemmatimonadales bacterium]|jgi:hypothetical protein
MRRLALILALPALVAAPAAAQSFEGTVTMTMSSGGSNAMTMNYLIKGDKMAFDMTMPGNSGPMAGKSVHGIVDNGAHTVTMLIAVEMNGSKGFKMTENVDQVMSQMKGPDPVVKALGTTETIAGYKCDDYSVTDGKNVTNLCMSHSLGTFSYPSNPMGGRQGAPAWARFLGKNPGFPLKVWTPDGKVAMVVTSIQKGSVPADAFTIPDGYMDMGSGGLGGMMKGMMGGQGGRGGGR